MEVRTSTAGDWTIVSIRGEFVVKYLVELRAVLQPLEQRQTPRVALDLTETDYVDSSAISLMLNIKRRFEARGGRVAVFGSKKELREIFSIVDLHQALAIYPDRESFEAAVAGGTGDR
jgi:anti-sigma B factor antagonist